MKKFTQIVEGETIEEFKQAVAELHSMVCLPVPSGATVGRTRIESGFTGIDVDNVGSGESTAPATSGKKAKKTKPVEVEVDADEEEEKSVISPSKLKKEAAKKVEETEPVDISEEDVLGEAPEAEEEEVIDFEKIREITQEIVDQYDMDKARALCQKFGARTVSALKQTDYAKFAAEAKKLLK